MRDDLYKGNSGEWAELYCFLKLLGDGEFYSADRHFNIIDDDKYPICSIFRDNAANITLEYSIDEPSKKVIIKDNEKVLNCIDQADFLKASKDLFAQMSDNDTLRQNVSDFLERIHLPKMKGKSADKRDLTLKIYDSRTKRTQILGFSVKSKTDGKATLFNAHEHCTSFLYKIKNFDNLKSEDLKKIEGGKIKNKTLVRFLIEKGCSLQYLKMQDAKFQNNLTMVDSSFEDICAHAVLYSYTIPGGRTTAIIDVLNEKNPVGFPKGTGHNFYEYKIRQFLSAAALGMTSQSLWQGHIDVTGGFIVVQKDGRLLCYHVYNWNDLQNYLFETTFWDQPSTGRHKYGMIEEENPEILRLNFQVRFR